MTSILVGGARPSLRVAEQPKAAEPAKQRRGPSLPLVAAIGGGVAVAAAGAFLLHRRFANPNSKVIGVIEGVELLSNPRLPRGVKASWGVPGGNSTLFSQGAPRVSIEHVDQGALGDCWNIAGHGAIAHRRPAVFEGMVREAGEHIIVDLPGRPIAVTRELPLDGAGSPRFGGSGPDDPVLWSAYVEKAQATLTGSGYQGLAGGYTKDAFRQLLGVEPVKVASRGTIVDDVAHAVQSGQPVAISTHPPSAISPELAARMEALNVKPNHYYIPTEVHGSGEATRVELFNPWGKKHPKEPIGASDLRAIFDGLDTPDTYVRYGTRG